MTEKTRRVAIITMGALALLLAVLSAVTKTGQEYITPVIAALAGLLH